MIVLAISIAIALATGNGMRIGEAAVPGPNATTSLQYEQPPDILFDSDPDGGLMSEEEGDDDFNEIQPGLQESSSSGNEGQAAPEDSSDDDSEEGDNFYSRVQNRFRHDWAEVEKQFEAVYTAKAKSTKKKGMNEITPNGPFTEA